MLSGGKDWVVWGSCVLSAVLCLLSSVCSVSFAFPFVGSFSSVFCLSIPFLSAHSPRCFTKNMANVDHLSICFSFEFVL